MASIGLESFHQQGGEGTNKRSRSLSGRNFTCARSTVAFLPLFTMKPWVSACLHRGAITLQFAKVQFAQWQRANTLSNKPTAGFKLKKPWGSLSRPLQEGLSTREPFEIRNPCGGALPTTALGPGDRGVAKGKQ